MPLGVVSGIGQGMGVLDWSGYRQREGAVSGVKLGRPIVTLCCVVVWKCVNCGKWDGPRH